MTQSSGVLITFTGSEKQKGTGKLKEFLGSLFLWKSFLLLGLLMGWGNLKGLCFVISFQGLLTLPTVGRLKLNDL